MESCACTLKEFVRQKYSDSPLLIADEKELLRQTTSGIEYLHEKGIFHRDLKPTNILISRRDGTLAPRIKLNNFAFQRLTLKADEKLSKVVLSKQWLPPEIYDQGIFTPAMDVWALGLVYEFVLNEDALRHAFGKDKNERIHNIRNRKSNAIQQLKDFYGLSEIYSLICSMLSFIPEERPTASAVLSCNFFKIVDGEPPAVLSTKKHSVTEMIFVDKSTNQSGPQLKRLLDDPRIPPLMPISEGLISKKLRAKAFLEPPIPVLQTVSGSRKMSKSSITSSTISYSPTSISDHLSCPVSAQLRPSVGPVLPPLNHYQENQRLVKPINSLFSFRCLNE